MSSETFQPPTRRKDKTGFAESSVQGFNLLGNTQSAGNVNNLAKPGQVTRKANFGLLANTLGNEFSGFKGKFSNLAQSDIDRLFKGFQNRKKFILGRQRQPGRQQLLTVNR